MVATMTTAFTAEATIAQPTANVWRALTDWQTAHRWMSGVDHIEAHGDTDVGTTLTVRARGKDRPATIIACEPERSLVLRSVQGGVRADYRYELTALDAERTSVSLVADCQTTGVAWRALAPLLRLAMRSADGQQLQLLKRELEA